MITHQACSLSHKDTGDKVQMLDWLTFKKRKKRFLIINILIDFVCYRRMEWHALHTVTNRPVATKPTALPCAPQGRKAACSSDPLLTEVKMMKFNLSHKQPQTQWEADRVFSTLFQGILLVIQCRVFHVNSTTTEREKH